MNRLIIKNLPNYKLDTLVNLNSHNYEGDEKRKAKIKYAFNKHLDIKTLQKKDIDKAFSQGYNYLWVLNDYKFDYTDKLKFKQPKNYGDRNLSPYHIVINPNKKAISIVYIFTNIKIKSLNTLPFKVKQNIWIIKERKEEFPIFNSRKEYEVKYIKPQNIKSQKLITEIWAYNIPTMKKIN